MKGSIEVQRYGPEHLQEWDALVRDARNGVFLFERAYMDYHADRFTDHSLLFRRDGALVAVLPASLHGDELRSHGGLTFGGLVTTRRVGAALVLDLVEALLEHLAREGLVSLLYKAVPHIYHQAPAEEDLYALFRHGAQLVRRDVSSTIRLGARMTPSKGRKSAPAVARRAGVRVVRSDDFHAFMALEEEHLQQRYGIRPVHTGAEMSLLARRFPRSISLFTAILDDEIVAGTIVYESSQVAHAQYIAMNARGRDVSAMDLVLHELIVDVYAGKTWFDFGISTENGGRDLNSGLAANKESYGARTTVYDFYELTVPGRRVGQA